MFVYLLEFKKIISFFYKEDLVSRCMYIHIKVDSFVYMYTTYFRIRKLCGFFRVVFICDLSLSWRNSSTLPTQNFWLHHYAWCVCVCVCVCVCDRALYTMDSHGYVSDPLWPWVLLTLWHEYMLKAIAIGAYSCHTVHIVTAVWSSRSMSSSDIGFLMYVSHINVFNALRGSSSS